MDARFPPAAKLLLVEGRPDGLEEFLALSRLPGHAEVLGPVEVDRPPGSDPLHRLTIRAPVAEGERLVRAAKEVLAIRSARKSDGALRVTVDPVALG